MRNPNKLLKWDFLNKRRYQHLRPLPDDFHRVYNRLYHERIIILRSEPYSRRLMQLIVPDLLELYNSKSKDPIRVFIDCPMLGAPESLVLSYILKCSPVPIYTTLIGPVGLGTAFILAGGTQGKRAAFPNSMISFKTLNFVDLCIVQNHSSILKNLQDKRKLVDKFLSVCAKSTSYSEHELLSIMENEPFLSPSEAINFGIIDHVVNIREENENRILDTLNPFSDPTYEQSRDYLF